MTTMSAALNPVRSGARGLVAAMAMSGMRELTQGLGWLERTPPEEIIAEEAPALMRTLSADRERAVVQVAHFAYGVGAGAAFGLLPGKLRGSRISGPAYGVVTWLMFELGIAPALGITIARRRTLLSHTMLLADHILYGVVVAGQLAPEPAQDDRG